jgi:hypothetical protein
VLDPKAAAPRSARVTALVALVLVAGCGRRGGVRPGAGADATAGSSAEAGGGGTGGDARPDAADAAAQPDTSADRGADVGDVSAADAFALGPTFGELPDAGVGFGFCSAGAWCWSGSATSGTDADLHGVWGSAANDVWAVGDDTILHWNGQAWSRVPMNVASRFGAVWGSGPRDVWIVGDGGTILHWDGTSLSSVAGAGTATLTAVWGSGPSDVWAVGWAVSEQVAVSVTLHFDGQTWTSAQQGGGQLASVWGSGAKDVWAVGVGTVLHWNGDSWSRVDLDDSGVFLTAVWGSGPSDVWAVGNGTSYHWDGSVWSNRIPCDPQGEDSLQYAVWGAGPGAATVISRNNGDVLRFTGQTWGAVASVAPARVNAMWGSGADDIWAVGDSGAIAHLAGGVWTAPADTSGVGELTAVWGSGPDDVWALGATAATHWNGSAWTKVALPVPLRPSSGVPQLYGVWGSGAKDVWVVGGFISSFSAINDATHLDPYDFGFGPSFILHWDGSAWSAASGFPSTADAVFVLHGVWGSGPADVWAVGGGPVVSGGDGPTILHWNGATWTPVASNAKTPEPLKAVWGSGPDDVWAVGGSNSLNGSSAMMLHFDGHVWSDLTPAFNPGGPALPGLEAVWGSGPNDVWAVGGTFGNSSLVAHWDGKAWTASPTVAASELHGVWGSGPDDVWAVGAGGVALHWTGTNWATRDSGTHDELFGVWGLGADDVWLVGADGAILHH